MSILNKVLYTCTQGNNFKMYQTDQLISVKAEIMAFNKSRNFTKQQLDFTKFFFTFAI